MFDVVFARMLFVFAGGDRVVVVAVVVDGVAPG